jgi:hypothetical protein
MSGSQPTLEIDYPSDEAIVAPGHYAVRLSSSEALAEAEVSIDRGPWQPCRHACGFWWYDWRGGSPGSHAVAARGTTLTGETVNAVLRRFEVGVAARL